MIIRNQKTLEEKVDTIEAKFEDLQGSITENWNQMGHLESDQLKLSDLIKKIDIKLKEFDAAIAESVEKIKVMEVEPKTSGSMEFKCNECSGVFQTKQCLRKHLKANHSKLLKCNICKESFEESWKLEKHMTSHQEVKEYACNICEKTFYMEWRLKKHMTLHDNTYRKKCHYFNNDKNCPFFEVGCMYAHEISEECKFGSKCLRQLCQFRHPEKKCKVCNSEFRIQKGQKEFQCVECDKFVCKTCAKDTHISEEFFMCSVCL